MCCCLQLCQMASDNPDIVLMKVDFDENRDIVKPLAIKVRTPHAAFPGKSPESLAQLCKAVVDFRIPFSYGHVQVLPYFHFYRGAEGRVAAFSASISKIQLLR